MSAGNQRFRAHQAAAVVLHLAAILYLVFKRDAFYLLLALLSLNVLLNCVYF